jgi:uncharacterized protein DUF6603
MPSQSFVAGLLLGFNEALEPLTDALTTPEALEGFLADLGWPLDPGSTTAQIVQAFGQLPSALNQIANLSAALAQANTSSEDSQAILSAIENLRPAVQSLMTVLQSLSTPANPATLPFPLRQPEFWSTFPVQVLDLLIYREIERKLPKLFGILRLVGVLSEQPGVPVAGQSAYTARTVNWKRLPAIVSAPSNLMHDVYGWGTPNFDSLTLLRNLRRLFDSFELPAGIFDADAVELNLYYDQSAPFRKSAAILRIPLYWGVLELGDVLDYLEVRLGVLPIPPTTSRTADPDGIAIFTEILGSLQVPSISLTDQIDLSVSGGFESDGALRAEFHPGKASAAIDPSLITPITAEARVHAQSGTSPWVLFGARDSTRVELSEAHFSLRLKGDRSAIEVVTELAADAAALVIDFSEADGFLAQIFGGQPQKIEFSSSVAWSSRTGLRFGASATPEITVPLHISIGDVVTATKLHLAMRQGAAPGSARLEITLDGGLNLGPLAASVTSVGLELEVRTAQSGNLGPIDVAFAFKPPDGVGLAIDADVVVGGGFLLFDPVAEQYAGGIQLELAETLSLTAFGLLTTRLPDGSKGFSLLVLIDVEFTPSVQLGFGFTLDGVGGLIGVNRTVTVDVLRQGLRAGTLGSILFPADPMRNAPRIISDLQAVFPAAKDRFLIGPMLKLGWGSPRLVTIELALILELPAPVRLIILGRLQVLLPEETHPIVHLHLDALGVIDFSAGDLALDAVLYDSGVAGFAVTGAMALRANWGAKPGFVLAVGGFNPRFPAPSGFPALERVAISLATGDNPRLRLEAYLALTSNTVQFGARLDLYAHVGPFSIAGYLAFDVLIVLEPFGFVAQIQAGLALKFNGRSIMSISLDMTLSAPTPWHAWGKASFSMLFISGTVSFDVSFGTPSPPPLPPPVSIRQRVIDALRDADNWTTQAVDTSHPLVSLGKRPGATDRLVHPLADLRVVQHVVPLDRDIDRFGSAVPVERSFSITVVAPAGASQTVQEVDDFFAPGEFRQMSDDAKLSAPAFESLPAGLRFGSRAYAYGARVVETQIDFTTSTLYRSAPTPATAAMAMAIAAPAATRPGAAPTPGSIRVRRVSPGFIDQVSAQGAASRSPLAPPPAVSAVSVKPPAFAVAFGRCAGAPTAPLDYMSARAVLGQRLATASAERRYLKLVPVPVAR